MQSILLYLRAHPILAGILASLSLALLGAACNYN